MSLLLGPPNDNEYEIKALHGLSEPYIRHVEPVGSQFFIYARRKKDGGRFLDDEQIQDDLSEPLEIAENLEEEEETEELLSLDPADWKEQDHYAVLGLSKLRYKATFPQLKAAHRKKVLKHHPDKKASSGNAHDDTFFKCIQKAYEILSDPIRRRQYDSIDPKIDDSVPVLKPDSDFFELFTPVFEREARFSKNSPVPLLEDLSSSRQTVESFYSFWHNFDSWRSFEYLDKEEKGQAENRDDKRYMEKKNKADRAKRKKEDIARLRKIVDLASAVDPRIKKFKEEDKAVKENKLREKREAAERAQLEEERIHAERLKEEEAQRLLEAAEKKEREAKKKLVRKERKSIKTLVKDANYFCPDSEVSDSTAVEQKSREIDALLEQMTLEETEAFRKDLEADVSRERIQVEVKRVIEGGLAKKELFDFFLPKNIILPSSDQQKLSTVTPPQPPLQKDEERPWTTEELSILIKAAKKFPVGTVDRWSTIADWVSTHSKLPKRREEEIIRKSNEVKKGAASLGQNEKDRLQYMKRHNDSRIDDSPTIRYDVPSTDTDPPTSPKMATQSQTLLEENISKQPSKEEKAWTSVEQAQLEAALKIYPPSWKGEGDRWEKIAEGVPSRNKKECRARVKFLTEQIKARKGS